MTSAHTNIAEHLLVLWKWVHGRSSFHYKCILNYIFSHTAKPCFESKECLGKVCVPMSFLMDAII